MRILLVEDNYLIAMELTDELNGQGAEVIGPAASVNEALYLIESTGQIDSAVLDINLKGEMIFPVVDALMELDVPFLFLTGYDQVLHLEPQADHPRAEVTLGHRQAGRPASWSAPCAVR